MSKSETEAAQAFANEAYDAVREHVAAAVRYQLPAHGEQNWRRESPAALAERIAVHAAAAILPVVNREVVRIAERVARHDN